MLRRIISDHSVLLCKFKLVGLWIKRMDEVNEGIKIRRKELREQQYKVKYESEIIKYDEVFEVDQMWKQVKQVVIVQEKCVTL